MSAKRVGGLRFLPKRQASGEGGETGAGGSAGAGGGTRVIGSRISESSEADRGEDKGEGGALDSLPLSGRRCFSV